MLQEPKIQKFRGFQSDFFCQPHSDSQENFCWFTLSSLRSKSKKGQFKTSKRYSRLKSCQYPLSNRKPKTRLVDYFFALIHSHSVTLLYQSMFCLFGPAGAANSFPGPCLPHRCAASTLSHFCFLFRAQHASNSLFPRVVCKAKFQNSEF